MKLFLFSAYYSSGFKVCAVIEFGMAHLLPEPISSVYFLRDLVTESKNSFG